MIHKKSKKKFSRRSGHRISMLRNLSKSLIDHEKITTTLPKAKNIRSIVEKLVTIGKNNSLHTKRNILSKLGHSLKETNKIINVLSIRYKERNGGYTRILKTGYRKGDCAPMANIQFV